MRGVERPSASYIAVGLPGNAVPGRPPNGRSASTCFGGGRNTRGCACAKYDKKEWDRDLNGWLRNLPPKRHQPRDPRTALPSPAGSPWRPSFLAVTVL